MSSRTTASSSSAGCNGAAATVATSSSDSAAGRVTRTRSAVGGGGGGGGSRRITTRQSTSSDACGDDGDEVNDDRKPKPRAGGPKKDLGMECSTSMTMTAASGFFPPWRGKENVVPEGEWLHRRGGGDVASAEEEQQRGAGEDAEMTDVEEEESTMVAPAAAMLMASSGSAAASLSSSSSPRLRRPTGTLRRSMTVPISSPTTTSTTSSSPSSSASAFPGGSSYDDTFVRPMAADGDDMASSNGGGSAGKRRRAKLSFGGLGSSSSSSATVDRLAPSSSSATTTIDDASSSPFLLGGDDASSKRRRVRGGASNRALGRSLSYNDAAQAVIAVRTPTSAASLTTTSSSSSASSAVSRRSSSRRPSVGSSPVTTSTTTANTTTTSSSPAGAGAGARRLSRGGARSRQASVSSTISVRSEHTPAPSSASSSRSSWSLAPETPRDEKNPDDMMQVDDDDNFVPARATAPLPPPPSSQQQAPSTPPQEIRAFDDLTITPKGKQRSRPALDRTPTRGSGRRGGAPAGSSDAGGPPSTPDLSDAGSDVVELAAKGLLPASSSPLEMAVITPEPSPPHVTASSSKKSSNAPREMNGYRALKQILRCASAAGGGSAMAALMASVGSGQRSANETNPEAVGEDAVVGREAERAVLSRYLSSSPRTSFSSSGGASPPTSLYVSGPPGTGKTAVVSASIAALPATCRFSFVNCMSLASTSDVWSRVGADWGFPASAVEHCVGLDASGSTTYVLVLDEVDCLLSSGQLLHALLCLPAIAAPAAVKVIAISNSLDLTARASIAALLGDTKAQPENLTFAAYGSKDMVQIVKSRVRQAAGLCRQHGTATPVDFDDKAIELVARKVEATNGDLRTCLAVAHGAVEVAEDEWRKKIEKMGGGGGSGFVVAPIKISLPHVLKAVAAHNKLKASSAYGSGGASSASSSGSSAVDNKVRSLNLQVRIILLSLLVARRTSGAANGSSSGNNVTAEALYPTYVRLLGQASSPFKPAAQADYLDLVMQAEVVGLISVEAPNRKGPRRAARTTADRPLELLVREQDLLAALGVGKASTPTPGGATSAIAIESEIRTIWGKEEHKWKLAEARRARAYQAARDED